MCAYCDLKRKGDSERDRLRPSGAGAIAVNRRSSSLTTTMPAAQAPLVLTSPVTTEARQVIGSQASTYSNNIAVNVSTIGTLAKEHASKSNNNNNNNKKYK